MGSPDLFKALTQTLNGADAYALTPAEIQLTPRLAVVVAILYMMAVDGDISDRESSQLQSVIGSDNTVLRRAVNYASSHDIDQFLQEAPSLLNAKARLCLLTNVCDSLMSDGVMADVELTLFDRLLLALGHTRISFQPYFDAIAIKDRISVFGSFDDVPPAGQLTPPLMLVVSMLYMMSADGSLAEEEIGRLSTIVGSSQALLKAGLRYVGKVRAPQFLPLAAAALDERQRMSVLLNACDAMMSDHQVVMAEEQLMQRMLDAFSVDAKGFDGYLNILRLKNDIPEDRPRARSAAEPSALPPTSGKARAEGVVFERKRTWEEETGEAGDQVRAERQKPGEAVSGDATESALSSRISRTMQDNIDNLAGQFDSGLSLGKMASNARDGETHSAAVTTPEGPEALRALRDAEGAGRTGQQGTTGIAQPGRNLQDAEATQPGKHWKDAEGPQVGQHLKDGAGSKPGQHWKDAEGPQVGQHLKDGAGSKPSQHWKDAEGPPVGQHLKDGAGSKPGQHWKDADGSQPGQHLKDGAGSKPGQHWKDADGSQPGQHWKDADGSQPGQHWKDADGSQPGQHWQDAATPGERRAMSDATNAHPGRHLQDDRKALDKAALDDEEGLCLGEELLARMDAVGERTRTIRDYLDPMLSARSIAAASRLPAVPALPPRPTPVVPATILRFEPQADATDNERNSSQPMLLAFDEGGPIMTQPQPPESTEEGKLNRKLRQWSMVLFPALFLTYGTTMVGETASGHSFVISENLATDARTVHQMATVQQTVYRVTPDAVRLSSQSSAGTATATGTALAPVSTLPAAGIVAATEGIDLSDPQKADKALENRKQELEAQFRRHQAASALAAERQQWFAYAKSIALLGIGMALWGVLFRSMRMLQSSSVAGIAGLLMTLNAYWLFVRI